MRKLMHHDHLHMPKRQPSTTSTPQNKLYDFSSIEVATDELPIPFVFLERHDGDMISFHDGVGYGGNAFEEVLGEGLRAPWEWPDEVYEIIWSLHALVDALEAERHLREQSVFLEKV
jgi:hypothetical protein